MAYSALWPKPTDILLSCRFENQFSHRSMCRQRVYSFCELCVETRRAQFSASSTNKCNGSLVCASKSQNESIVSQQGVSEKRKIFWLVQCEYVQCPTRFLVGSCKSSDIVRGLQKFEKKSPTHF